ESPSLVTIMSLVGRAGRGKPAEDRFEEAAEPSVSLVIKADTLEPPAAEGAQPAPPEEAEAIEEDTPIPGQTPAQIAAVVAAANRGSAARGNPPARPDPPRRGGTMKVRTLEDLALARWQAEQQARRTRWALIALAVLASAATVALLLLRS